jgi:integrase/recombinase XerD
MNDDQLIALWLHGRPESTRRSYASDIAKLRSMLAGGPLELATLSDLQRHIGELAVLAPRSQCRAISALKSFYGFHCKVGTLRANPAISLIEPRISNDLAERILDHPAVEALISAAGSPVERLAILLLYMAALRASELCSLRWRSLAPREDGGQITVTGKGGKTRAILIPASLYGDLMALQPDDARPGDPIFRAERDPTAPLGPRQLLDIVKRAARRAGLTDKVSCHWLRHAHASHALDANAPITLVRDTLGHSSLATTNRYAHARPNDGSARFLRTGG